MQPTKSQPVVDAIDNVIALNKDTANVDGRPTLSKAYVDLLLKVRRAAMMQVAMEQHLQFEGEVK